MSTVRWGPTPEARERHNTYERERRSRLSPEQKERERAVRRAWRPNPEQLERKRAYDRERSRQNYADPEQRERQLAYARAHASERHQKRKQQEGETEKRRARQKRYRAKPEVLRRQRESMVSLAGQAVWIRSLPPEFQQIARLLKETRQEIRERSQNG